MSSSGAAGRDDAGDGTGSNIGWPQTIFCSASASWQEIAQLDIAELVRRATIGDTRAWERLVIQYARLIRSITSEFKLEESDAADVAQTTWSRLLEHIDRTQRLDHVGFWLTATARHECLRLRVRTPYHRRINGLLWT